MKWFVHPDTVRLDIGDGQWIDVKKELNKGEKDKASAMLIKEVRQDGRMTPDFEMMGKAETIAYLVDWSLKDDAGKKIDIVDQHGNPSDAAKLDAINGMSSEGFDIISDAIKAHVDALDKARPSKKGSRGGRKLSATSASAA